MVQLAGQRLTPTTQQVISEGDLELQKVSVSMLLCHTDILRRKTSLNCARKARGGSLSHSVHVEPHWSARRTEHHNRLYSHSCATRVFALRLKKNTVNGGEHLWVHYSIPLLPKASRAESVPLEERIFNMKSTREHVTCQRVYFRRGRRHRHVDTCL